MGPKLSADHPKLCLLPDRWCDPKRRFQNGRWAAAGPESQSRSSSLWVIWCLFSRFTYFLFLSRVSFYSPGCLGTTSVAQAGLEPTHLPVSASQCAPLWFCFVCFKWHKAFRNDHSSVSRFKKERRYRSGLSWSMKWLVVEPNLHILCWDIQHVSVWMYGIFTTQGTSVLNSYRPRVVEAVG